MKNNLAEIKKAYNALITAYINVLNESPQTTSTLWGQKYLTKLFIESHIKTSLTELPIALRYYNEKLKSSNTFRTKSTWIVDRIVDCNELSSTLTYWQSTKNIITTFIPLLFGVITAWLGIETIYQIINLSYFQFILFFFRLYILVFFSYG